MNNNLSKIISLLLTFLILFLVSACGEVKKIAPKKSVSEIKSMGSKIDKTSNQEKKANPKNQNVSDNGKNNKSTDKKTAGKDTKNEPTSGDIIEINEKIFLQKINDIYFNFEDYKNATIIIEGMFSNFENFDKTETRPVVYREGPGCCGNDGWGGFFLLYDGKFPKENDWIRVVGKPIIKEAEGGWLELFLKVDSIEIKKERGEEFVTH